MPSGTIWQTTSIQTVGTTRVANVIYLRQNTSDSGTGDPRKDVADALWAKFWTPLAPALTDIWSLSCIEVRDAFTPGQNFYRELYTLAGTKVSEALPPHCCALMSFNTIDGGKGKTGRTYISGATIDDEVDNNLTEAFGNELSNVAKALTEVITQNNVEFVSGPKPGDIAEFAPWVIHDIRQPYTRLKNRRADTRC